MNKVKKIFISLAVLWLVCYALMFVLNGLVFQPMPAIGGELQSQPRMDSQEAPAVILASSNNTARITAIGPSEMADLFLRPILPASMVTFLAGIAVACGDQLFRLGYGGHPPQPK